MKKYLLTAAAALVAAGAFAQEVTEEVVAETVTQNVTNLKPDFKSNWFISVGAGPQMFFGDHDRQIGIRHRISPALDVAVGKWFSPAIGVRLMWSGLSAKGVTQTNGNPNGGMYSTGQEVPGKWTAAYGYLAKSKFDFFTLHADVMFDLCNIIGGYSASRVYSIAPYIGVGWGHVMSSPHKNAVVGNVGLMNMFHVSKAIDINIDIRGTVMNDDFDGHTGRRQFDGLLSVTAGLTYRFAPRGWRSASTTKVVERVVVDNDAINALRARNAELVAQNEKLEKEMAGRHTVVSEVNGNYLIYFPIGVSTLNNEDRAQLEMVARMIKNSKKGTRFNVIGYADKATGTASINEKLSRERAQSVRTYLVDEFGIPADRLDVAWQGGVGNMFLNDPALSRVVIISAQ